MDNTVKNTSIRCDIHPPLSAIMFCDACKQFLCRICAEVRAGGRVCSTCKQPCREPSTDEFAQLVVKRKKDAQDALEAKAAAGRINDQLAKAKVDREARLKADFAARKAALLQQKQAAEKAASVPQTPQAPQPPQPPQFGTSFSRTLDAAAAVGSTGPMSSIGSAPSGVGAGAGAGGTMYNPNAPMSGQIKVERDPLAKLGERAHLNVIGKAKIYMLVIGILTVLANGIGWFLITTIEDHFNVDPEEPSLVDEARMNALRDTHVKDKELEKRLEAERAEKVKERKAEKAALHAVYFYIKLVLIVFVLVGVAMIALVFLCDGYPREATLAAFILFIVITGVDLLSVRTGGFFGIFLRIAAITALYNGMVAGQTLHKMRLEEAEAAA